ncbi:MAG TPA: PLP-dependent aminotransferase family protein [Verrucomicrobiae bacterium]|nr:PLP-dependent aminotransferase family protein [Verrucomicrobiae bacterium]
MKTPYTVAMIKPAIVSAPRLYEQTADKVGVLIERGTLRPGERVPSVRRLSRQHGISVSTVLQAYMLLENRGLIEARPQSGYYVRPRLQALPPEPAMTEPPSGASRVSVDDLVARVMKAMRDPDIVPLGAGGPDPALFPNEKLHRVLAMVARRAGASANTYDVPPGSIELRRQIARRSLDWGCSLSSEEFVTTNGCMEALNVCLRAVAKPGDTIAVESPAFFGMLQAVESLGMKTLEISSYPRDGMCLDALDHATRRHKIAAVVVNLNFQNPLGSCMPDEKKKALVELLARKEIPLIEDDLFGDLYFGQQRPKTARAFDKKGLVLLCGSVSKTLAPGFRVGWTAPGRFQTQVERLKHATSCASPVLTQLAIAEFLKNGGYEHYVRRIRRAYAQQVQTIGEAIGRYFPAGTKVTRPQGGFLLWVEFPKWVNALELHRQALAQNISICPGPMFSPKQSYKNFIRINCGHPWSERIEKALVTIGRLAEKQR